MKGPAIDSAHARHAAAGLDELALEGGTLRATADGAGPRFLVLSSDCPLAIAGTLTCRARLVPGWDGTLGYARYGLALEPLAPGRVEVRLDAAAPPAAPGSDPVEASAYAAAVAARASRFPATRAGFARWQREYRRRLADALMPGAAAPASAPPHEPVGTQEGAGFRLQRLRYLPRENRPLELLLSLPEPLPPRQAPVLLALHGHEAPWGQADAAAFAAGHADDFCAWFAERGWAVLQPATLDHRLQDPAWTLEGEWTWDALRALDVALLDPSLDASRVAVCGLSTGGHLAMHALALDPRIRAGVVGCVLSTWNHCLTRMRIPPHCDCGSTARLAPVLEQCDWAALAAPKPVQFQHGRKDACFFPGADPALLNLEWNTGVMPPAEFDAHFGEIARAYRLAGAEGALALHLHGEGHRVDAPAAFAFLEAALRP